ncbi:MAG: MBL fold metallo-hydrolase [Clostridiales bacterium]|nr:MBL fold metallo-hydrolase [Clostridiales bacterium]
MTFKQLNDDACKTYFIADTKSHEAVLIDPVIIYMDNYIKLLEEGNLKLTYVIDTHTHADHITAAPSLIDATGCEYVMCNLAPAGCVSTKVKDGDVIKAAGTEFKFLTTPGHTHDSLSVISENRFFTGDFLFLDDGGAGRDDLPGGNPADHWESFQKLNNLSDELIIYPAHDYRDRTPSELAQQKRVNPHLEERTKSEFVSYINDLILGPADWMYDVLKANVSCTRNPKAAYIPNDSPACEVMGTIDPALKNIEVAYIDAPSLKKLIDSETPIQLVDVREAYELDDNLGYIDGIANIPVGGLMTHLNKLGENKKQNIVIICHSGARAGLAAKELANTGYSNVKVLDGGMISYRRAGF